MNSKENVLPWAIKETYVLPRSLIRTGHVANSSSTSYTVTNKTGEIKTIIDLVKETRNLFDKYIAEYGIVIFDAYENETGEDMQLRALHDAQERLQDEYKHDNSVWEPNETKEISFGDEDGDVIGRVYDYVMRDGGNSESFSWNYRESLR